MSKALKCERCGKCFDPAEGTGETIHFDRYLKHTPEDYRECKYSEYTESVDFCPACTAHYKDFMKYGQHSLYIPEYIRERNRRQDKMIERLIGEKDELKARNTDLKGEIEHYKWEAKQREKDLEKYKEECRDLGAEIHRQMREIEMLKNERANWRKKYEDIFNEEFAKGSESIERLKIERNEAYVETKCMSQKVDSLLEENHDLKLRCSELEKENSELKAREEEDWDTDVAEAASHEARQWQERYEKEKRCCEALRSDLTDLYRKMKDLTEENEDLRKDNEKMVRDAVTTLKESIMDEAEILDPDIAKDIVIHIIKQLLYKPSGQQS